jgi:hypothetical protein
MSWEILLQTIETLAVVVGVVFGLMQLRQLRHEREIQAGTELLHSLPQMAAASLKLYELPDNLTGQELRSRLGDRFDAVFDLLAVFECLGPLVARGQVPIDLYAEYYRGATVVSWRKVRRYVLEERQSGWTNLFEWVQWLAERMEERGSLSEDIPAFERLRHWKNGRDYDRLRGKASSCD